MKTQSFGISDKALTSAQRWMCFAAIFFWGFLAAFNLFKAAPAIQYIAADLAVPDTMVSQIMGSYSIAALLLAFPGMWFAQKMGFKFSALVAGVSMAAGTLLCAFATSTPMFFAGRVIEGIGYGLVAVIGPNSVPRLLPAKSVGLAMGIWAQWLPIGTLGAFFLAPIAYSAAGGVGVAFSWHAIWMMALVLELVGLAWLVACYKLPAVGENERAAAQASDEGSARTGQGRGSMAAIITVCLSFMVVTYLYVGNFNTFYPTYLQNFRGMSIEMSSLFPIIASVFAIVGGVWIGAAASRRGLRKPVIIVLQACLAVTFLFCLYTPGEDMIGPWIGTALIGVVAGTVPACTYSIIPVLASSPKQSDFGLAALSFFTATGKVLAGFLVSPTLVAIGYEANAHFVCAPLAIAAAVLVFVLVRGERPAR